MMKNTKPNVTVREATLGKKYKFNGEYLGLLIHKSMSYLIMNDNDDFDEDSVYYELHFKLNGNIYKRDLLSTHALVQD